MTPARTLEWCVAVGALFLLTGVADNALHVVSPAHPLLARVVVVPFFVLAVLILWRAGRSAVAASRAAWPAVLLVALAGLSWTWSTDPAVTAMWWLGLVGTTAVGLMLALRFDPDEQLAVLLMALGLVAAVSAMTMLVWPEISIRPTVRGPTWAGVFEDNNLFGRIMSLSALAYLVLGLQRPERRALAALGCVVSVVLLIGSRSLSAQCVAGVSMLGVGLAHYRRRRGRLAAAWRLAIAALVVGVGVGVVVQLRAREAVSGASSLSGRVGVWEATLSVARERPVLGHGYATFWPRMRGVPQPVSVRTWPLRHPHNGFVQLFFELGAVGVLAFALPFALVLRRAVALRATRLWPLAFLLFLVLSNLAETGLLGHKIFWALYVAVAASLFLPPLGGRLGLGGAEQD